MRCSPFNLVRQDSTTSMYSTISSLLPSIGGACVLFLGDRKIPLPGREGEGLINKNSKIFQKKNFKIVIKSFKYLLLKP